MPLILTEAQEADAPRIAEIHMAAFHDNAMLLAQFPTPAVRAELFNTLVQKARDEIRDPQWTVLVVCEELESELPPEPQAEVEVEAEAEAEVGSEEAQGTARMVISFAKWRRPIEEPLVGSYLEAPWQWPAGTRFDILEEWTRRVEAAGSESVGTMPCYSLSYVATDPGHHRRGAASMLVKWGIEQAKIDGVPVALESTKNGWPLYEKLGFKAEGLITMLLEGVGEAGGDVLYEEMCFVWRP